MGDDEVVVLGSRQVVGGRQHRFGDLVVVHHTQDRHLNSNIRPPYYAFRWTETRDPAFAADRRRTERGRLPATNPDANYLPNRSKGDSMGGDTNPHEADPLAIEPERVLELDVEVDDPIDIGDIGDGRRRIIPITGGTVSGRIDGEVLDAGADYQLFRENRATELVAKYAVETDAGSLVYVENRGIRVASPETKERLRDGKPVDSEDIYFRSVPEFETADPDLKWLERSVFVASGIRRPYGVKLAVYRID